MKNYLNLAKIFLAKTTAVTMILVTFFVLLAGFALAAWTGPTAPPPTGNVGPVFNFNLTGAPQDASISIQNPGNITAAGLGTFGNVTVNNNLCLGASCISGWSQIQGGGGNIWQAGTGSNSAAYYGQMTVSGTGSLGIKLSTSKVLYNVTANNVMSVMDGNVGIGVLAPSSPLTVTGPFANNQGQILVTALASTPGYIAINSDSGQEAGINLNSGGSPRWWIYKAGTGSGGSPVNDFGIWYAGGGPDYFHIAQGTGYVGLSTMTPKNALQLAGNSTNFGLAFVNTGNVAGKRGYRLAYDNNRLTFQRIEDDGSWGTNSQNQIAVDPANGDVGIGLDSTLNYIPSSAYKLSVMGPAGLNPKGNTGANMALDSWTTNNDANMGGSILRFNEYFDPNSNWDGTTCPPKTGCTGAMRRTRTGGAATVGVQSQTPEEAVKGPAYGGNFQFINVTPGNGGTIASARSSSLTLRQDGQVGIGTTGPNGGIYQDSVSQMGDAALTIYKGTITQPDGTKSTGGGALDIYGDGTAPYAFDGIRLWDSGMKWDSATNPTGTGNKYWGIWHETGNASPSTDGKNDLRINQYTGNGTTHVEVMTLQSLTGYVGIGTTKPAALLSVGPSYNNAARATTPQLLLGYNTLSPGVDISTIEMNTIGGSGVLRYNDSVSPMTGLTYFDTLFDANNPVFRVSHQGNFGIGLSNNIVGKLTVNSMAADGAGAYNNGLVFTNNTNNTGPWTHAAIWSDGSSGWNGALVFGTDGDNTNNTTGITEKMRIMPNGNVGIGTKTPAAPLDVNGRIALGRVIDKVLQFETLSNVGGNLYWGATQLNGTGGGGASSGWTDGGTSVYTTNAAANVGIGTTAPAVKLDVKGTINASGDANITGNANISGTANVAGNTNVTGNVTIGGSLKISGGITTKQCSGLTSITCTCNSGVIISGGGWCGLPQLGGPQPMSGSYPINNDTTWALYCGTVGNFASIVITCANLL